MKSRRKLGHLGSCEPCQGGVSEAAAAGGGASSNAWYWKGEADVAILSVAEVLGFRSSAKKEKV